MDKLLKKKKNQLCHKIHLLSKKLMPMIIFFFKAKSYKLENSFHGSRIMKKKKKKNQSIILKIKMKLEVYICKKGLYH